MSTKFEQLLDLLVNEDMEGANALFHEIVVEKSRTIYENLIAEEEDEDMDEAADEDEDESVEEGAESDDQEMDESADEDMDESEEELEDSYMMDGEDDGFGGGESGDAADEFGDEIGADGPEDDEHDHEGQEDSAIYDIKNAIAELEAAFAELERAQGSEEAEMDMEPKFGDDSDDADNEDQMMGSQAFEGRRMTREYVEKVGHNYGGNTQKQQGDYAGAGTGETQSRPVEGRGPVSSGKGKPSTGANASNILGDQKTAEGTNVGTSPAKVNKGINPEKSEQFTGKDWETNSAPGGKAGVKNLKKQGSGYPGNNKTPGPVGSGKGDKAGQTSDASGSTGQFLPQHTK